MYEDEIRAYALDANPTIAKSLLWKTYSKRSRESLASTIYYKVKSSADFIKYGITSVDIPKAKKQLDEEISKAV
ncbi:hypothetical protein B0T09DRAFT_383823 [Sordaria sp. MPI-SDFR-AT-0083]|nr:hypothetical protein B0T09DRAFT_383823 [Sordaria sp. MPI-SDFR-AT-0083]